MNNKSETEHIAYRQQQHMLLHAALQVHVVRDGKDQPMNYLDKFGEEGVVLYNLYRGDQYGEGHADRLLDNFMCQRGLKIKCSHCDEYRNFLRKESSLGVSAPPLSLRGRLLRQA
jgi:hypothetical protein